MATLTPTLTLTSTDATTDQLSFSVTDSISVTDPFRGMSKHTATTTGGNNIITDAADSTKLIYIRHTGVDGSGSTVTTDLYVEDENDVRWAKLNAGEWLYVPANNGTASSIQLESSSGTIVAEYMYFSHA